MKNAIEINSGNNRQKGLPPLVGNAPEILILGTLPGNESIRNREYYNNSRNRFWKIMARITGEQLLTYVEKEEFLKSRHIALWTVLESAIRTGSTNKRLKDEKPNDLCGFLKLHPTIHTLIFEGEKAGKYFSKYFGNSNIGCVQILKLPSTSSTNTHETEVSLCEKWKDIFF